MANPRDILDDAFRRAGLTLDQPVVLDPDHYERIRYVARVTGNRSGARVLLTCALAKLAAPQLDIRRPYTEIGTEDSYSGRNMDETYISEYITEYNLPLNPTTAFLTPAWRNIDRPLTPDVAMVGRPRKMYTDIVALLDAVERGLLSADDLLVESIRQLLILREEHRAELASLRQAGASVGSDIPLSSEEIVSLVEQHLSTPGTSRLPVLIVAAAYQAAASIIGEQVRPLQAHNAADLQTGALGDLEITLVNEDAVVTVYEMKLKEVAKEDILLAQRKLRQVAKRPDNYIFITTKPVAKEVADFAYELYRATGTEYAILDCTGFLRHFLHFFHRVRGVYLQEYEALLLSEPDSAVGHAVKMHFLTLRRTYEAYSADADEGSIPPEAPVS